MSHIPAMGYYGRHHHHPLHPPEQQQQEHEEHREIGLLSPSLRDTSQLQQHWMLPAGSQRTHTVPTSSHSYTNQQACATDVTSYEPLQ